MNGQQPGTERRKTPPKEVRFLLPIWGRRYVKEFLTYFLPTLLAPGNIPGVAREIPTRLIIMTSEADVGRIEQIVRAEQLQTICPVEIRLVDELITSGNASTTITLAYEREVRRVGPAATDTCFFFLVSDYLVADGSFLSVLRRMQDGASGVFAGNFQVIAEDALQDYRRRIHEARSPAKQNLQTWSEKPAASLGAAAAPAIKEKEPAFTWCAIPARELVAFAFNHLHPATIANAVNLPIIHNFHSNRLFWRVDENTLIGRFYLMHMICIRPEVADFEIGASCDYSFMPEMCPSGNIDFMTDSDDYLVVEVQPKSHEVEFLRPGPLRASTFAHSLVEWTTAQHRANARQTVVYHASDLPPNLDKVRAEADGFIKEVNDLLVTPPQPFRGHIYWRQAIAAHRVHLGKPLTGDDLDAISSQPIDDSRAKGAGFRFRRFLVGTPPTHRLWQRRWPDYCALDETLKATLADKTKRVLIVTGKPRTYSDWAADYVDQVVFANPRAFKPTTPDLHAALASARFDLVCFDVTETESRLGVNVKQAAQLLLPSGKLVVLVINDRIISLGSFKYWIVTHMATLQPFALDHVATYFVGSSRMRTLLQSMMDQLARRSGRSRWALPILAPIGLLLMSASALLNRRQRPPANVVPRSRVWSSVTLVFDVPDESSV